MPRTTWRWESPECQKLLTFKMMTVSPDQENAVREFGLYEYDKKSIERGREEP